MFELTLDVLDSLKITYITSLCSLLMECWIHNCACMHQEPSRLQHWPSSCASTRQDIVPRCEASSIMQCRTVALVLDCWCVMWCSVLSYSHRHAQAITHTILYLRWGNSFTSPAMITYLTVSQRAIPLVTKKKSP